MNDIYVSAGFQVLLTIAAVGLFYWSALAFWGNDD
jgi:hypothetical protein